MNRIGTNSFAESLKCMMVGSSDDWLQCLIIPAGLRPECLKRLMNMNIHPLSVYPDISGLAEFLKLKKELFPDA